MRTMPQSRPPRTMVTIPAITSTTAMIHKSVSMRWSVPQTCDFKTAGQVARYRPIALDGQVDI